MFYRLKKLFACHERLPKEYKWKINSDGFRDQGNCAILDTFKLDKAQMTPNKVTKESVYEHYKMVKGF